MAGVAGSEAFAIILLAMFGACVGSFLNVVIYRVPRGESIVFPGSHCPSCGRAIRWFDNIPILSWVVLRGRCRFCKASISPRYILIEVVTALLVAGLYACYYLWDMRSGMGSLSSSWPVFTAHAALLCGMLGCSAIDIRSYHLPLEICWFVSIVGMAAATVWPDPNVIPQVSPFTAASCVGAAVGLIVAIVLLHRGLIQPSFIDADVRPSPDEPEDADGSENQRGASAYQVAVTPDSGVRPRREVLREVLFLTPAIGGAVAGYLLVRHVEAVRSAWLGLYDLVDGGVGRHLDGFFGSLFGYFIGGLWIWGMRILGTLVFGREAMGLGDVHLLAAVGAVTGWVGPVLAFFIAPFFGLLAAILIAVRRRHGELPYGPWLSLGLLTVMLFQDKIWAYLKPGLEAVWQLLAG
ncbi:MAG: prepilin peptidase [Candidatus Hydrogenedentes bacterium]|nr:prepilin peptidase [Candidatus Hydrogenedentota bacterium]